MPGPDEIDAADDVTTPDTGGLLARLCDELLANVDREYPNQVVHLAHAGTSQVVFSHFHDTLLGLDCRFQLASDEVVRCLPIGSDLESDSDEMRRLKNQRPTVELSSPANGDSFLTGATIPISAEGQAFSWDPAEAGVLYNVGRKTREVIVGRVTTPGTDNRKDQ